MVLQRAERVRAAWAGEAETVGYLPGPDARRAVAADQQACDREHLRVGDHIGEHGLGSGERGGQAPVPVLPALGERGRRGMLERPARCVGGPFMPKGSRLRRWATPHLPPFADPV